MSDWRSNYADPILPACNADFEVMSAKLDAYPNGTQYVQVMARLSNADGDFDLDDPTVLAPEGQTAWGTVWMPKYGEEEAKKSFGKETRIRKFLEIMENAGADLVIEDPVQDKPSEILVRSLAFLQGRSFAAAVEHRVDENGVYPTKAEINMMRVSRCK